MVALAADRLTAAPAHSTSVPAIGGGVHRDVAAYLVPADVDSLFPRFGGRVTTDPFGEPRRGPEHSAVASRLDAPTVPPTARGRMLTAILIADERRIAVIDDATVKVGDVLRDGARVSAIQPDRVWVVEKDGRWRMLTLTTRGQ